MTKYVIFCEITGKPFFSGMHQLQNCRHVKLTLRIARMDVYNK